MPEGTTPPKAETKPTAGAESASKVPAAHDSNLWPSFAALHTEIDRMFERFYRGSAYWPRFMPMPGKWLHDPIPAVDLSEGDNEYVFTAELPGVDPARVDVKIADDYLTISGEKSEEKEERKAGVYLAERHYGAFERAFRIPDSVAQDRISATFRQGVLKIVLPKSADVRKTARKIDVKAA